MATSPRPVFHSEVSARAHLAHLVGRWTVKQLLAHTPLRKPTFHALRGVEEVAKRVPGDPRLTSSTLEGEGWSAIHYQPYRSLDESRLLLYFHGGGFVACGVGTHRMLVEELVRTSGRAAITVAYRQYPAATFATSVADCKAAFHRALELGYRPENIVIAGDSAGGALAVRVAGELHEEGHTVSGVISLSGWLDFTATAEDYARWAGRDAYLPAKRIAPLATIIVGRTPTADDNPIAKLAPGYPPLFMICGANEFLRVDSEKAFARCHELGIPVDLHLFRGGVHAFPVAAGLFPEGREAIQLMLTFMRDVNSRDEEAA